MSNSRLNECLYFRYTKSKVAWSVLSFTCLVTFKWSWKSIKESVPWFNEEIKMAKGKEERLKRDGEELG